MTEKELDFKGRVAIVTGAGQGMGREHATMLASRGARVVVNDIVAERAEDTANAITKAGGIAVSDSNNIITHAADLIQTAVTHFGGLDIVVNNAGIQRVGNFWEMDEDLWWHVFDTSLRGVVKVARHAMPHLIASGTGRLINVASNALMGAAMFSPYATAKAGIWGLGNTLAAEAREVGVQVNTILPVAWTPMTEGVFPNPAIQQVLQEQFPPEAVAAFVTWLAHQDTTVSGEAFEIGGVEAARTVFSAMPRMKIQEHTPENWARHVEDLMQDGPLTPLQDASDSFRQQLVYLAPELESEIPVDAARAPVEETTKL